MKPSQWILKLKSIVLSIAIVLVPMTYNACGPAPKSQTQVIANSALVHSEPPEPQSPEDIVKEPIMDSQKVAVFMAIGQQGSRMFSCDKGRTWKGYQEYDPLLFPRCTQAGVNCDHGAGAAKEIAYGDGGFIFNYGGDPGQFMRTYDGEKYDVLIKNQSSAGVSYGQGVYLLGMGRDQLYSKDLGSTWQSNQFGKAPTSTSNARGTFFADYETGRFFIQFSSGGVQDLVYSEDLGLTFKKPNTLPSTCGVGSMAFLNQRLLLLSDDLCMSDDGGKNWSIVVPTKMGNTLLTNDSKFLMYRTGSVMESSDGVTWSEKPLLLNGILAPDLNISLVTFHPLLGAYVGVLYRAWYEKTEYYYSDDGTNWLRVDKESGRAPVAPHPIKDIAPGYLTHCPVQ